MELTISVEELANPQALYGTADKHLRQIRNALGIKISARDSIICLKGDSDSVTRAAQVFEKLQDQLRERSFIADEDVSDAILEVVRTQEHENQEDQPSIIEVYLKNAQIAPQTHGQEAYVRTLSENDLTICVGPAGTGKTYLAVAMALSYLKQNRIQRIVLVRPAVEAGEKLGFLPGDMQAKVNPFLRPLFDAMHDMMSFDQIRRFMQNDIIEVVPLAFMRGRTLNQAAVILDEAQNSTVSQMLMFLTRLGHNSKMIVTGDDSQTDLEHNKKSGLVDAISRLADCPGVGIVRLGKSDIVRHPLVSRIVARYEKKQDDRRQESRQP